MNTAANTITLTQNYIDGEYTCGEPPNFLTKPVYYSYNNAPEYYYNGCGLEYGRIMGYRGTWRNRGNSCLPMEIR